MLKFYKSSEIDLGKWDECILKSEKGTVYMMSWYLNIINPGWQALIIKKDNMYSAVMPLLIKKKFGIAFHPEPPLAQQLGLINSTSEKNHHLLNIALSFIKRKFVLLKYPLNNDLTTPAEFKIPFEKNINYFLDLDKSYRELHSMYRRDRKARLKQAKNSKLTVSYTSNPLNLIALFRSEVASLLIGGVSEPTIMQMKSIAEYALHYKSGFIIEVADPSKTIISTALFLRFKNRLIYLVSASNRAGKNLNANTLLLDYVISEHANSGLILDFEGSGIPGVADFYKGFGADVEQYFLLNYETLLVGKLIKIKQFLQRLLRAWLAI